MFALASALSDHDLLARIGVLAGKEREATAELVAHLAVLDARPSLHAAQGCGSLFGYCTDVLRLSEDATCNRISAARVCRLFPMILDLLASGAVSLTSVRMLRPHLTPENHEAVLANASGKTLREVEALIAELAPRPDVPTSVRKLPETAREHWTCRRPPPSSAPNVPVLPPRTGLGPSSRRPRLSATASSSRSGRRVMTRSGACRRFSGARSRTAMRAQSSSVP